MKNQNQSFGNSVSKFIFHPELTIFSEIAFIFYLLAMIIEKKSIFTDLRCTNRLLG